MPLARLTVGSWRGTTSGLKPNYRMAEKIDRYTDYTFCRIDETIMLIVLYKEQAYYTYTEKRTGAADRVQVHLTHGLVVEQGHPEETHTQRHMVHVLQVSHWLTSILDPITHSVLQLSLTFVETLLPNFT